MLIILDILIGVIKYPLIAENVFLRYLSKGLNILLCKNHFIRKNRQYSLNGILQNRSEENCLK